MAHVIESVPPPFTRLNVTPVCAAPRFVNSLSVHLLVGIWVVSTFLLL